MKKVLKRYLPMTETVYGTLTKTQKDGVITVYADEEKRTVYEVTGIGNKLLTSEIGRLKELYGNAMKYGEAFYEKGISTVLELRRKEN